MLFTLIVFVVLNTSAVVCACTNCNKCFNGQCNEKHSCFCKEGCIQGYWGNKCLNNCPEQCLSCGRQYELVGDPTYHKCYECSAGYHNGSSTNCLCPITCEQCTSTTTCTTCYNGWYDSTCEARCAAGCRDNTCRITDGSCTLGCVNGKYGTRCQKQCPTCKNSVCDQAEGTCTDGCVGNFDLGADSKCNVCIPGKYGNQCQYKCPTTCKSGVCSQYAGTCTQGCIDNILPGADGKCSVCILGKYGPYCQNQCSPACKDSVCDRENGSCTNGCISPNTGDAYCETSTRLYDDDTESQIPLPIVGAIVGGMTCVFILIQLVICVLWRRRQTPTQKATTHEMKHDVVQQPSADDVVDKGEPYEYEDLADNTTGDETIYSIPDEPVNK